MTTKRTQKVEVATTTAMAAVAAYNDAINEDRALLVATLQRIAQNAINLSVVADQAIEDLT
jgi:hypothetical protein